jgi:hypothetical protein
MTNRRSPGDESLAAQLREERARAARLAAELVLERDKVRQLQEGFNRKDSEAWMHGTTIETLKTELRGIAGQAAELQKALMESQAPPQPTLPPNPQSATGTPQLGDRNPAFADLSTLSPAAQDAQLALRGALLDLEDRLQQAVALVLDEFNTRTAAEARIRDLEAQLAAVRRRITEQ